MGTSRTLKGLKHLLGRFGSYTDEHGDKHPLPTDDKALELFYKGEYIDRVINEGAGSFDRSRFVGTGGVVSALAVSYDSSGILKGAVATTDDGNTVNCSIEVEKYKYDKIAHVANVQEVILSSDAAFVFERTGRVLKSTDGTNFIVLYDLSVMTEFATAVGFDGFASDDVGKLIVAWNDGTSEHVCKIESWETSTPVVTELFTIAKGEFVELRSAKGWVFYVTYSDVYKLLSDGTKTSLHAFAEGETYGGAALTAGALQFHLYAVGSTIYYASISDSSFSSFEEGSKINYCSKGNLICMNNGKVDYVTSNGMAGGGILFPGEVIHGCSRDKDGKNVLIAVNSPLGVYELQHSDDLSSLSEPTNMTCSEFRSDATGTMGGHIVQYVVLDTGLYFKQF